MQAIGESLQGDVQLWFDHLAPGSIIGYDMFTDLLIDSWSRNTDKILECQSSKDYVIDNQYIDEVLSQLDHSSPDMFQIMSVPAIHKKLQSTSRIMFQNLMLKLRGILIKSYKILCYYYVKQS